MSGRKRFTLSDGIALVKKVLYVNPFLDPARWMKITDRLSEVLGRCFTIRSVRERLNLIFLRFCEIRRRKLRGNSGTEEEQSELEDLLQQAADIARECGYTPPPSTARQLAERDDIEKRATRNSVACPPAKRCVDNGEEDALAAYAELTVGDGVEPADGASTSQAQTLLNSMYEPENIEIHIYLPDCELEDNRTASCPAPDCITTAAPSRAQTPASSPSDVAVADSSSSLLSNLFTCDLLDYQAMQLCMGAPLIPTQVHSGMLRQHMPSLRPAVIGTLQSKTTTSNLKRTGSGSR
ncbi:hypothetical protein MRX96_017366 [Rhipicephalus microplus]